MRIFTVGQRVRATCEAMLEESTQLATMLIVSQNNKSLAIELDHPIGLRIDGGMAVTVVVQLMQNSDGSITDLWGNLWKLEEC